MESILSNERGQAIAEMTVSMIAIMVVFLAVLFAFAIGSTNIDNLIECRGIADNYSYSQVYGGRGESILTWNAGGDGRMYTNDDVADVGTNDEAELFKGELQSESIDLINNFGGEGYPKSNFAADLAGMDAVFLTSADLTSYSMVSDPYEEMHLEDIRGAFASLIYSSNIFIKNTVFMPIMNIETEEE